MMNDRTKIEILREEIAIPRIVQQKAEEAYAIIREQNDRTGNARAQRKEEPKEDTKKGLHNIKMIKSRKMIPLVAVMAMLLAGAVVAAGTKWSAGISEKWQVEEARKESLQQEGAVSFAMQSQTQNGVTITAEQSITDNYSVYIAFRVDGYGLREGLSPGFEEMQVTVDGMDGINYSAGFFDGLVTGEDGILKYADGTAVTQDKEGAIVSRYVREDGSMTYWISMTESERGWALDRDIHVELKNLCGYEDKAGEIDPESIITGVWNFGWNLQGTENRKEWEGRMPLGDSGAVICRVELSPISGYVECDWPRQREVRQAVGPEGEVREISRWVRAPRMSGVRLKDGTEYPYLFSGDGSEGYVSSEQESIRYYACRGCERLIEPEQVEGLFFEGAEGEFYEVMLEAGSLTDCP